MQNSSSTRLLHNGGLCLAIATIADLPEGGGHTARLERLVQTLTGLGHHVTVWNEHAMGTTDPEMLASKGAIGGGRYEFVLGKTERASGFKMLPDKCRAIVAIAKRMRKAAAAGQLDVMLFNNLSLYDTYPLTRLAVRLGVKTIQCYEDERLELVSAGHRSLARRFFGLNASMADRRCPRMADAIIAISHYLLAKYTRLAHGVPVRLVPTIIDCDHWLFPPEIENDCPLLFYAGTFGEQDEMDNLVEALVILRDRGKNFRMTMLGGNHREPERIRTVRRAIEQRGLSDIVELPGYVSSENVRVRMQQAAVLLNLRRDGVWSRSGLSTKLSEYLASGRLVLASAVGEATRYLRDGESALLVSSRVGSLEIANALEQALSSIELRRKIGSGGHAVARRCFDTRVAAGMIQALLSEVISGPNP